MADKGQPVEPNQSYDAIVRELQHYRERWRATEALVNQRLTLLMTGLAAVIAATAAILTRDPTAAHETLPAVLAGLWVSFSLVSEGIFVRLVHKRLTICRTIENINLLRRAALTGLTPEARSVLTSVYRRDCRVPRRFAVLASPSAAAYIASLGAYVTTWFIVSHPNEQPPYAAFGVAALTLASNLTYYHRAASIRDVPASIGDEVTA